MTKAEDRAYDAAEAKASAERDANAAKNKSGKQYTVRFGEDNAVFEGTRYRKDDTVSMTADEVRKHRDRGVPILADPDVDKAIAADTPEPKPVQGETSNEAHARAMNEAASGRHDHDHDDFSRTTRR